MNKKEAYKIVFDDLKQIDLFCGKYDAKNGNEHFILGILTVMEHIAYGVGEEAYEDFGDIFLRNMDKSIEKSNKKLKNQINF